MSSSGVGIIVPAYDIEACEHRRAALHHVLGRIPQPLELTGERVSLMIGSGTTQAEARNRGARMVGRHGIDVLVFIDADSLVEPGAIRAAAALARRSGRLVFCYDVYNRIGQEATRRVLAGELDPFDAPVSWSMWHSLSAGAIAIRRDLFERLEGFDEDFRVGFEDYDFAMRCRAELGPEKRIGGELAHLWHPRPAIEPEQSPDRDRYLRRWGKATA